MASLAGHERLLAVCAGIGVGTQTAMAGRPAAEAMLAGVFAAGTSAVAFDALIGP